MNNFLTSADAFHGTSSSRRDVLRTLAALSAAGLALPGHAQAYPSKPIKLVVGYPAGGSVDLLGRVLADAMAPRIKATAVVDNQGGAAGAIAAQRVATSAPDGYTLLVGSSNELVGTRMVNPAQRYDGLKDFTPIGMMATAPVVFTAAPHTGIKSIPELLDLLRRNPGKYSYGSSGVGSTLHFAGELFKQKAGVFMTHIPYRGVAPLTSDLAGGSLDFAVLAPSSAMPFIRSGRITALAVSSTQRLGSLPQVPAMTEFAPLKGYELVGWYALMAPKGLPADVTALLSSNLQATLQDPAVRKKLEDAGMVMATGREDLTRFMAEESGKYEKLAAFAKMRES